MIPLARDIDILGEVPFLFVILDEGTKIKNLNRGEQSLPRSSNACS